MNTTTPAFVYDPEPSLGDGAAVRVEGSVGDIIGWVSRRWVSNCMVRGCVHCPALHLSRRDAAEALLAHAGHEDWCSFLTRSGACDCEVTR